MKTIVPAAISSARTYDGQRSAARVRSVTRGARASTAKAKPLALHAPQEFVHDAAVEILAEIRVFDARVDRRVVVDFDDRKPVARLLQVDPVKPVADRRGRAERKLHDFG